MAEKDDETQVIEPENKFDKACEIIIRFRETALKMINLLDKWARKYPKDPLFLETLNLMTNELSKERKGEYDIK